jgi:hypothetical protein
VAVMGLKSAKTAEESNLDEDIKVFMHKHYAG